MLSLAAKVRDAGCSGAVRAGGGDVTCCQPQALDCKSHEPLTTHLAASWVLARCSPHQAVDGSFVFGLQFLLLDGKMELSYPGSSAIEYLSQLCAPCDPVPLLGSAVAFQPVRRVFATRGAAFHVEPAPVALAQPGCLQVSMNLYSGQIFCLLGHNGAGMDCIRGSSWRVSAFWDSRDSGLGVSLKRAGSEVLHSP